MKLSPEERADKIRQHMALGCHTMIEGAVALKDWETVTGLMKQLRALDPGLYVRMFEGLNRRGYPGSPETVR